MSAFVWSMTRWFKTHANPGLIKMSAFDWSMTRWYKTHATGW
jgi:hypothetical protein